VGEEMLERYEALGKAFGEELMHVREQQQRERAAQARDITDLAAAIVHDITRGSVRTRRGLSVVMAEFESQCIGLLAMYQTDPEGDDRR